MKKAYSLALCIVVLASVQLAGSDSFTVPLYEGSIPCANSQTEEVVIDDKIRKRISKVHEPTLEVFLPKENPNGTGVVICPGGGYTILAYDWEGTRMAEWFNSFGVAAFVLKYRLPHWENEECRDQVALMDAQTAMELVRGRSEEWNVDPQRLGIMGFSAGGHLASTLSTHYERDSRPDFSILMYPVITMDSEVSHGGSRKNLIGENPSMEEIKHFSNEMQVNDKTPPAILIHATDDKAVIPENSIRYYQALVAAGVPAAMHIYASGGHGFSFAEGKGSVASWPDLVQSWMEDMGLLPTVLQSPRVHDMVAAATELMAKLSMSQNQALFEFDHNTRPIWTFLPVADARRPGIALRDLDDDQRDAVFKLVQSGLSGDGYDKVRDIINLESVLQELENNYTRRDPEQYHIALYGTPGMTGKWAWKFEGHHVALNFTIVDGQVVGVPTFLGSNPAEVPSGDQKGLRVLAIEEDAGFDLLHGLSYREQRQAIFLDKAPYEVLSYTATQTGPLENVGILASAMNSISREDLDKLIETYLSVMPDYLQERRRTQLDKAGRENIRFAWAGALNRDGAHYYRVQGPTFLIEFANTQNNANHAHAVWRDFDGDFGRDLLKEHMASHDR